MAADLALSRSSRTEALPLAAAACLGLVLVGMFLVPQPALRGWLAGFCFAAGVPLGGIVLSGMMRLVPGLWDDELEPFSDTVAALMPLAALLFLPVLVGAFALFPWEASAGKGVFRETWMTLPFWTVRSILFLLFTVGFSLVLRGWPATAWVIAGLMLFAAAIMPTANDWILFLDPEVHFSGFSLTLLSQWFAGGLAVSILLAARSNRPVGRPEILGALLLAALLAWAYLAFMQYFISWSDNLPPIVRWYAQRSRGVWAGIEVLFCACRLLPLLLLLFAPVRRSLGWLCVLSVAVLAGNALEAAWLVVPAGGATAWGLAFAVPAAAGMALCAVSHRPKAGRPA